MTYEQHRAKAIKEIEEKRNVILLMLSFDGAIKATKNFGRVLVKALNSALNPCPGGVAIPEQYKHIKFIS